MLITYHTLISVYGIQSYNCKHVISQKNDNNHDIISFYIQKLISPLKILMHFKCHDHRNI